MAIYLGFDSSTQSLTALAIEVTPSTRRVLFTRSFRFDDLLPHYGTRHGVLPSSDPSVAHAPPLMWAEALDRVMGILTREEAIDWSELRAISGSAQQHGSVYLGVHARDRLPALDPEQPLAPQLSGLFSRATSPIWMDTSTTRQCAEIERALGGWRAVARLTGSRCYERFTAAQIRKFAQDDPEGYARTDRIHLVSSWLASLLAGRQAPIDHGDGSGMNLMSLEQPGWSPAALEATADGLSARLPPLAPSWQVVGPLAPYWRRRYGLPPAHIVAWSGDNPCSLIGTGLVSEGLMAISLGTSDTVFAPMTGARPSEDGTGHVFASPAGHYMGMTVFKNGSLAREAVRDAYALDWPGFSAALRATPAGNAGGIVLPWFDPEITPPVRAPSVHRHDLDPSDAAANVRAVVEAQMMSMALHSRWMGAARTIRATGGASANREILQVMADVFEATVVELPSRDSAALGAALRACHADHVAEGRPVAWPDVVRGFTDPAPGSRVDPIAAHAEVYRRQIEVYARLERRILETDDRRPNP